ncbi:MAG: hypothetical protein ACXWB2_16885, partial [Acidimicrobiales bacterium]
MAYAPTEDLRRSDENEADVRTPGLSATRWIGLVVLLAVVVGTVALLVPLRTGLPLLTGGAGARQQSCGPAAVAWSDGLDEPGRTVPATTDPGRDTSVCREKSTGRIALVVVSAALLGAVLVLIDV